MVRQFRQAAGEALLELPAGTLEAGEDQFDCVVRELKEETGYRANKLTPMFRSYLAPGLFQRNAVYVSCRRPREGGNGPGSGSSSLR